MPQHVSTYYHSLTSILVANAKLTCKSGFELTKDELTEKKVWCSPEGWIRFSVRLWGLGWYPMVSTNYNPTHYANIRSVDTVYPKKYAHGFCFAVLCCGYTLTDFPISIRLTSLALWQSNDCPSASKATLMNMDKYFMWIHYERLHNHSKAKHNKTVCIFLGIYCTGHITQQALFGLLSWHPAMYSNLCYSAN